MFSLGMHQAQVTQGLLFLHSFDVQHYNWTYYLVLCFFLGQSLHDLIYGPATPPSSQLASSKEAS